MLRRLLVGAPLVTLLAVVVLPACGDSDRFDCGKGSCARGSQVCVNGNGCTSCAPAPTSCTSGCGCITAGTTKIGDYECGEAFTCGEDDGERVLSCKAPRWACG